MACAAAAGETVETVDQQLGCAPGGTVVDDEPAAEMALALVNIDEANNPKAVNGVLRWSHRTHGFYDLIVRNAKEKESQCFCWHEDKNKYQPCD